jgi:hypothetical protein
MSAVVLPAAREFWLEHPDRVRAVKFVVEGGSVWLSKKVGSALVSKERLSLAVARERYSWYVGVLGYVAW